MSSLDRITAIVPRLPPAIDGVGEPRITMKKRLVAIRPVAPELLCYG